MQYTIIENIFITINVETIALKSNYSSLSSSLDLSFRTGAPWVFLSCCLLLLLSLNRASHPNLHAYGLVWRWTLIWCCFSMENSANPLPQSGHWHFFSSSGRWTAAMWASSLLYLPPQWGHTFFSSCLLMWSFRCAAVLNILPHVSHPNFFTTSSCIHLWCCLTMNKLLKLLPQTLQIYEGFSHKWSSNSSNENFPLHSPHFFCSGFLLFFFLYYKRKSH